ncbi:MAG: ABC transporter permease, partial [Bacteroidia bacterium]
ILKREKFLQLSRFSYLLSKILLLFVMAAIQTIFLSLIGYFVLEIPGNPLAFSGMLFSVFCAANLMGLVLSSSFNSPVTIYIIIPLVIIPQMLLGGAMFKYSRLNEFLGGGPNEVPPIANVMVARWAYEGIAVNEYQSNAYEREMFLIDKLESKLNYKVSYVMPKLEELIERREKRKDELSPKQLKQLDALIAKISKDEFATIQNDIGKIEMGADEDSLSAMKAFLTKKYNFISEKKEAAELALKKKSVLKEEYINKNLDELMTSSLEKNKIIVDSVGGQFVQIMDPIFKDPQTSGLGWGSHFYAPYKSLFGKQMSTYSYNLLMIWLLNIFCFLLLYFDVFKSIFVLFGKWKRKAGTSS